MMPKNLLRNSLSLAMLLAGMASVNVQAQSQSQVNASSVANAAQGLCCDTNAQGKCVTPMPNRASPSRVSEAGRYSDLYKRMDKLDTGNCANAYHLNKTQAWLNLSRELYHEGDGSASVNAAYDEAEKIVQALEDGKAPSLDTAMIQDAAILRPDLWQIAADRKSTAALLGSAAREVAYCEVYLVRAGHAQTNLGGKARVEPLLGMAQDVCQAAKDKAPCAVPGVAAPVVQAPLPVAHPVVAVLEPVAVVPVVVTAPLPKRQAKQDRY
jgi:putative methionine-R-sulfoxide reductase with GAF domain